MAEYIEREAVIDLIQQYANGNVRVEEAFLLTDLLGDITNIKAADVQPVNRWISVEDELPDINTPVIGCDRSNGVGEMVLMKNGRWYRNGMSWSADAIIYWQPLPEPPKPTE